MGDQKKGGGITWTKIVDRGGRRVRWYARTTDGPGRNIRLLLDQFGLRWCRRCRGWHPKTDMRSGLCREHRNQEYRENYAGSGGCAIRERVYSRKRDAEQIDPSDRYFIFIKFDGRCAYCGNTASTLDHVIPITREGNSQRGNLLPACISCNSKKRTRPLENFLARCANASDLIAEELCMAEVL